MISAIFGATFATSPAGADTTVACTATVVHLPHESGIIAIRVSTAPNATVAGAEYAGGRSWSMSPAASANALGRATLVQKVATVASYEVVRVTVRVTWQGSNGHCVTQYTPPSLVARN
jgi:hypothetical protein